MNKITEENEKLFTRNVELEELLEDQTDKLTVAKQDL